MSSMGYFAIMSAFRSRLQVSHFNNPKLAAHCQNNRGNWPLYPAYKKVNSSSETCCLVSGITLIIFNEKLIACGGTVYNRLNRTIGAYHEQICYSWEGGSSMQYYANMTSARSHGVAFAMDHQTFVLIGGITHGSSEIRNNTFDVYTKDWGFRPKSDSSGVLPNEIEFPCLVEFQSQEEMYMVANSTSNKTSFFIRLNRQTLQSQILPSPPINVLTFSCAGQYLQKRKTQAVIVSKINSEGFFVTQVFTLNTGRWTVFQEKLATTR